LLASKGLRVVLVDRKASVADGVHTTGIFVRKTWEDFPLPDEQLGRAIRRVTLFSPARRPMELVANHDEFRIGRMSRLYVYLLDQCCRAGVTWLASSELLGVDEGLVLRRNGKTEKVAARFVIGGDGARSSVARHLGLDANREFLVGVEDVLPSRGGEPRLDCYLDPRVAPGYIAWVADDGAESHVGVAGYRDRFNPAESLQRFKKSLNLDAQPLERRGGLIPVNGILSRISNRNGLLIGDAAGAVSPLTAGGLDPAIRLSAFAADVVAAYLDTGDERVLAQYSGDRFRARFISRQWMRRTISAVDHPLLIELGCAALRLPPLRSLAAHVFFGRGSFPDVRLQLTPAAQSS
jgi:flavin-dependent dehydrogenase